MTGSGVIVGFPKCGTTALCRELERRDGVAFLRAEGGQMEYTWPQIEAFEREKGLRDPARTRVHKFTAYIYNAKAIGYLAALPERRFVVCIRNPVRALVSWHNFHRRIAVEGRETQHFAWIERDFYATCTLEAYYERFARRRLQYHVFVQNLLDMVEPERVIVVSQERMAQGIAAAADAVLAFVEGREIPATPASADRAIAYDSCGR